MSSENGISAPNSSIEKWVCSAKKTLVRFFNGRAYPAIIAALVAVGHITGAEFYFSIPFLILASLALVLCESTKSLMMPMLVFVFQITLKHSPGWPTLSKYYFEGARLVILLLLAALVFGSLGYRFVVCLRTGLKKHTQMLAPLCVLSAAFILNGTFSSAWNAVSLLIGFIEAVVYFLTFYIFYIGLSEESTDGLLSYFCYITLLTAFVLIIEVAFMFLTYDGIIVDGSVIKEKVNLGWGIWNPIGFSLTVLIPILVLGGMRMRYPAVYITASVLTYLCAVLTMSRNALIFASLALLVCYTVGCFAGNRKLLFRIITLAGVVCVLVVAFLLREKIAEIFATVMNQGFDDNGRFEHWKIGFQSFLSAVPFGIGFCGIGTGSDIANFIPAMAHNTVVQILSAMGIFGLAAYAFYRIRSLEPFIKKPSLEKSMLLIPILITVGMSLIDNFVFYVYTVFYYSMSMAIAFIIYDREKTEITKPKLNALTN